MRDGALDATSSFVISCKKLVVWPDKGPMRAAEDGKGQGVFNPDNSGLGCHLGAFAVEQNEQICFRQDQSYRDH
jgi:hypothetical protein